MIRVGLIVIGAVIGSFLNVVIHRLPRRESLCRPASHCPHCGHHLRPRENVPILSYLVQRGRCSACRRRINPRYLLIEILTPLLLLLCYANFGWGLPFIKYSILILLLIPITFIDIDHKLILDRLTIPGTLVGLGISVAEQPAQFYLPLSGAVAGALSLLVIALLGRWLYGRESMGGGDIKLAAMIGAFAGAGHVLLALFLAFVVAAFFSIIGMAIGRLQRQSVIPFGPFIAFGSLAALEFQDKLISLYLTIAV